MADHSSIEWTDATWNPVRGCRRVSPGCGGPGPHGGCYAEAIAARFSKPGQPFHGFAEMRAGKPRWTGKLAFGFDLDAPLRWRRPRRIFVNSMSDLFLFSREEVATVFAIAVAAHLLRGHILQILTKRSAEMRAMLADPAFWEQVNVEAGSHVVERTDPLNRRSDDARALIRDYGPDRPPPGIWLGVSAEDQRRADERVPDLLTTPAAVRFVSAEPLLGRIDFGEWIGRIDHCGACGAESGPQEDDRCPSCGAESVLISTWGEEEAERYRSGERYDNESAAGRADLAGTSPNLDWIITGGESGPNARPMNPQWARDIRDQCAAAGVPFHFKQWGAWAPDEEPASETQEDEELRGVGMMLDGQYMRRLGKARAGRLLDDVEHNGMPEVRL